MKTLLCALAFLTGGCAVQGSVSDMHACHMELANSNVRLGSPLGIALYNECMHAKGY